MFILIFVFAYTSNNKRLLTILCARLKAYVNLLRAVRPESHQHKIFAKYIPTFSQVSVV